MQSYLSWVMQNFTYTPHMNYVGEDSFRFLAKDQENVMSQLMIVNIEVYEPCLVDDCLCKSLPAFFINISGFSFTVEVML